MKQGIMNAFSDVVLVVTLLSGTEKRVPWATVQVPFCHGCVACLLHVRLTGDHEGPTVW